MYSARTSVSFSANRARRGAISLAILLLASGPAAAQQQALSIGLSRPDGIRTDTRQAVSSALVCGNSGGTQRSVELEMLLPEGWKALAGEGKFTIPPKGREIRIVSFLVPGGARAGTYSPRFRLLDAEGVYATAECALAVTILPKVGVKLQVLDQPPFALAGDDYEVRFLLSSTGNTDIIVDLYVRTGASFPYETPGLEDLLDVALPAGGAIELLLRVHASTEVHRSTRNPLQLSVRVHGSDSEAPEAVSTSIVEVIPVSSDAGTLMHTIPLTSETMGSVTFSNGVHAALQETLKAEGSLDENGEHRLELFLNKKVGTDVDPLVNREDRYSVRYSYDFLDVRLGDHSFGISPLLLMDKYGRGAGVGVDAGPLGASTFVFKDFWADGAVQGLGGNIQYTLTSSEPGEEILYRAALGAFSPLTNGMLVGLWQQFNPLEGIRLQLDAAMDFDGVDIPSPAILASAQGQHLDKTLSWNARYMRAWPDFNGVFHDSQIVSAGAGIKLLDNLLRFQGGITWTDKNLRLDPALDSAERSFSFTAGAAGTVPWIETDAALQWNTNYREDLLQSPDFQTVENSMSLSLQKPLEPFDLRLSSTIGAVADELDLTTVWSQKYAASAGYTVSESVNLRGSIEYSRRQMAVQTAANALGFTMGAVFNFPGTRAEAGLRNEWSFGAAGLAGIVADVNGRIAHTLPWGHSVTAEGDLSLTLSSTALSPSGFLSLLYSVPFEVPVSRKRDAIAVRGTVTRQETGDPVPGVVLRLNGSAAVTGGDGGFTFLNSSSGSHYLSFDPRTLGLGVIPAQTMPVQVVSPPGSETRLDLAVVEGSAIGGSVAIYGYPSETSFIGGKTAETAAPVLQRLSGLGGQVVELSDGTERKRRVTGADGRFVFEQIRPGTWTLEVLYGEIPSYHSLEQRTLTVTVPPGERLEVEFRVVQEQRRIQMLDVTDETIVVPGTTQAGDRVITLEGTENGNGAAAEKSPAIGPASTPTPVKSKPVPNPTAARIPPYLDPYITNARPTALSAPVPYPPYADSSYGAAGAQGVTVPKPMSRQ